jgi:hypothetical protein
MTDPIFIGKYYGQNWLITPAAPVVGEPPPRTPLDQKWLVVLSGVVSASSDVVLQGNSNSNWFYQTVFFQPGNGLSMCEIGSSNAGPLNYVINKYHIPRPYSTPPDHDYVTVFAMEQMSPFVSLSWTFDANQSVNAGYAVRVWRPHGPVLNSVSVDPNHLGQPLNNIFEGINVDLAIRDNDAYILALSYNITILGHIGFADGSLQ